MANKPAKKPAGTTVTLDPNPKGELKALGGSQDDKWNLWLANLTVGASPYASTGGANAEASSTALCRAMASLAPADPVEGIIIAQLLAANEASLMLYRKGWAQPPEYFQARTKYLQLADKASRTALMLTERLDHHRGRGQQQIVVKHVTVNADQAMVAETITTVPALQSRAQPTLDQIIQPELVGGGGGQETK
ncbi:hypothetical protein FNL55_15470 [Tardiphaga sp. vice352]|uniref:hypothetical protein n=1 Tax=unclassified Tardiphaga TaxID=2631404 RepID=UPI0011654FA7|nr:MULTISPECIES: hypothetical protein [unclassified Tardiphaga]QDM17233.1 hypothetical protein FNL53_15760 [Tardiphaga sp. vice278]QDM22213.1 hypothetical protein FIU28_14405 [Tardiphaga sp. vice154]QDM32595.1 hypothetical protein FNL55_15470 [Tardiphaga sp. vice352]